MLKEILLPIKGPEFLWMFTVYALIITMVSKIILRFDGSQKNKLPSLLDEYELALLSGGVERVIELGLMSLVLDKNIIVDDEGKIKKKSKYKGENEFKKIIYDNLELGKILKNYLKKGSLRIELEKVSNDVLSELREQNIIESKKNKFKRLTIAFINMVLIFTVGITKLILGITRGKPVMFLVMLLALLLLFLTYIFANQKGTLELIIETRFIFLGIFLIFQIFGNVGNVIFLLLILAFTLRMLTDSSGINLTALGKEYIRDISKRFLYLKKDIENLKEYPEAKVELLGAIYGIEVLRQTELCADILENVIPITKISTSSSSSSSFSNSNDDSGCSSCSSGCSSCSGGCGGCGD